jgi:hypothetical protein
MIPASIVLPSPTSSAEILKGFLVESAKILKDAHLIYAKNLNTY